jgi:hypothetical protein
VRVSLFHRSVLSSPLTCDERDQGVQEGQTRSSMKFRGQNFLSSDCEREELQLVGVFSICLSNLVLLSTIILSERSRTGCPLISLRLDSQMVLQAAFFKLFTRFSVLSVQSRQQNRCGYGRCSNQTGRDGLACHL